MLEPLQKPAMSIEDIDKAKACAADRIMLGCILFGVGHIDVGADGLHVEGRKPFADPVIVESIVIQAYLVEVGVEYVDSSATEVGGQDESLAVDFGEGGALENSAILGVGHLRMINLDHRGGRLNSGVPSGNRAIFRYPHKDSALAGSEKEIGGAAVEHDSCRRSGGRLAGSVGNCNHERDNRSGAVVQSGSATGIVRDPPWTTWG